MRYRVDKLVAKQAFEAVHEVLQHYQDWSMDLEQRGEDRPEHLISEYGDARRLRDYLRNVLRAQAQPELDLSHEDRDLLASCCLFAVQTLSGNQTDEKFSEHEQQWMQDKLRNLSALAIEIATQPARLIEGPGRQSFPTREMRGLMASICAKTQEGAAPIFDAGVPVESGEEVGGIVKGDQYLEGQWMGGWSGQRHLLPEAIEDEDEPQRLDLPGDAVGATVHFSAPTSSAANAPETASAEAVNPPSSAAVERLPDPLQLDTRMIKDPRLRSMLQMDIKSFRLATRYDEPRLAAMCLSAVFESLVVDIALRNRGELGLLGTPDTWKLLQVVPKILGGRFAAQERHTLHHLISCRNLVRPSVQLTSPIVVTKLTVDKMITFVRHFLAATGLQGTGSEQIRTGGKSGS